MMHGDISNQGSYNIGFRLENSLLKPKKGFTNVIPNLIKGKWKNAEVDKDVYDVMYKLYWNTEYMVSLIVDRDVYNSRGFEEFILNFPFNHSFVVIDKVSEITTGLNTGLLTYFVTNDIIEKSLINSQYALTLQEFMQVCKVRGKLVRNGIHL